MWKRPAPAVSVEGHPHGNGRRLNVEPHNRRASLIEGGASECDAGAPFVEEQYRRRLVPLVIARSPAPFACW
jgi:hypothetical protein